MTKKFKAVKASIITGIVLVSVIVAILPTTSAGIIFDLQSVVIMNWEGGELQKPVVPRGELRVLTLNITYYVATSLFGAGLILAYEGKQIAINIEITETPSWCYANIAQGTIAAVVVPNGQFHASTTLTLQVEDDAPAYALGSIKIKAAAQTAGLIQGYENDFTLSFIPDYKPLIKPSLPETNTKEIDPMDTATFPITIENLGNARTVVLLNVVNLSNGWNAMINSQLLLEEGDGSTATAYLVIRPPKDFGYHYDEKTITISMQPVKADDYTQKGEITYETFLVRSRGFSTPGFEITIFLGAFAITFLIFIYTQKGKK